MRVMIRSSQWVLLLYTLIELYNSEVLNAQKIHGTVDNYF